MISHSEFEISRVVNQARENNCKLVKGSRPLLNFKFYLDIENSHTSSQIETKIGELGGSIVFFLTENVTHFVTDKWAGKQLNGITSSPYTLHTSQISSVSNCEIINSNDLKSNQKIRSRADAMLYRARRTIYESVDVTSVQKSPTEIVKTKGILIWNSDYTLKFLENICSIATKQCKNNTLYKIRNRIGNPKILKGNFIKVEAIQKYYRPYYQLITEDKWPTITLTSNKNLNIFQYPNEYYNTESKIQPEDLKKQRINSLEMTRKSGLSKIINLKSDKKNSSERQCGYCEICRVEYDILTAHLKTDEHIKFVKNDDNFIKIDSLINTKANIDAFLRINKNIKQSADGMYPTKATKLIVMSRQERNSAISHNHTDNKVSASKYVRQTRQSSVRSSITVSLCGTPIENSGIVRSRRQSVKKINYAEPKEDDENSGDSITELERKKKTSELLDEKNNSASTIETSVPRVKSRTALLYKVVETNKECPDEKEDSCWDKNIEQSIIVKFRKIRKAELSLLNGEAENFMFPKKICNKDLNDSKRHKTAESIKICSSIISNDKTLKRKSAVMLQTDFDNLDESKKKKRDLQQNFKVYLNSSSPNRFTDQSYIHPFRNFFEVKRMNCSKNNAMLQKISKNGIGDVKATNLKFFLDGELSQYKFSFERVPQCEIWYQVFHRQDESQEKVFEYFGDTGYRRLPYEMGPLPSLQPRMCQLCIRSDITNRHLEISNNIIECTQKTDEAQAKNIKIQKRNILHKKKGKRLLTLEIPRKSPREHASTLAILSCLIQQKSENTKREQDIGKSILLETKKIDENKEIVECDFLNQSEQSENNADVSPKNSENVKRLRRGNINLKAAEGGSVGESISNNKSKCIKKLRKPLEFYLDDDSLHSSTEHYVNVHKLRNEIDYYLLSSFNNYEELDNIAAPSVESIDQFSFDFHLTDLIFGNSTKTDKNVCGRTKAAGNKLRLFNIFSTNKKRKNKTGWPTKKKVISRQQQQQQLNILPNLINIQRKSKSAGLCNHSPITPPETDSEEKCRSTISSTHGKDNKIGSFNYLNSSDKTDNSDIFTVSSDSLDTVLDVGSQMKTEDQQEIIKSSKSNVKLPEMDCSNKAIYKSKCIQNRRLVTKRGANKEQNHDGGHNQTGDRLSDNIKNISDSLLAVCENKDDMVTSTFQCQKVLSSSMNLSSRKLRKPRGKWYCER